MNALEMIHTVSDVESRLVDEMSRKIYAIRIENAIYRDDYALMDNIRTLDIDWHYTINFESFLDNNNPNNIIIFGTGERCLHILNFIKHSKYKDANVLFCDNNPSKWNHNINLKIKWGGEREHFKIISPSEAFKIADGVIMIGTTLYEREIYKQIIDSGYSAERVCKFIRAVSGWQYFDYFKPNEHEIFVDCGCFNGQTSLEFVRWAGQYDKIYAFEANPDVLSNCNENFKKFDINVEMINKGLWNKTDTLYFNSKRGPGSELADSGDTKIEVTSIDEVLDGKRVTFIKMDIEGAEYKALLGAEKTIKKWRPRLAICVYHKPEDILEIPALLLEMQPDYKFALRQYAAHGWETVLYAY